MARIRSIHPGLFTDEAFVSCSDKARLLYLGVLTEADDRGVFEWKPLVFKMRLLPADNVDCGPLMDELSAANMVTRFTEAGKEYGVVRNFCRYQRPKKPVYRHPFPDQYRTYVGLTEEGSPPVPHQSPTSGEISPQREEEGGRRKKKKEEKEDAAGAASSPGIAPSTTESPEADAKPYAFQEGVIRLKKPDLDKWKAAFKNLDVEAELISLAEWVGRPENAGHWFHALSGALAKRNRQAKERVEAVARGAPKADPWSAIL